MGLFTYFHLRMKFIPAILLIPVFMVTSCTKKSENSDLYSAKIKSTVVSQYPVSLNNGLVTKGASTTQITCSFDKKGNLTAKTDHDLVRNVEYKFHFIFNENGKKIEQNFSYADNRILYRIIYGYDGDDFMISERYQSQIGGFNYRYEYQNDEKGNQIVNDYFSSEDKLSSRTTYSYDSKNRMIEMKYHYPITFLSWRKAFTYNDSGTQKTEISYNTDGSLSQRITYLFDDQENLVEQIGYGFNDVPFERLKFDYSGLDKYGNWTVQKDYRNDECILISEREIAYYE